MGTEIGNTIGSFVRAEEVLNTKDSSSHPRILVNMKEGNPCPDFITISIVHGVWKQPIEVWEGDENSTQNEAMKDSLFTKGKGLMVDKLLEILEWKEDQREKEDNTPLISLQKELFENQKQLSVVIIDQREVNEDIEVIIQEDKEPSIQEVMKTPLEQWEINRIESLEKETELQSIKPQENISPSKISLDIENKVNDQHKFCEDREEITRENRLEVQAQSRKTPIEEENRNFKDIEMSPTRNLNDSFEGTMNINSLMEDEGSTQEILEDEDRLNDLGIF